MNAAPLLERIAASHAALAPGLAGGPAWAERRRRALAALLERGLPDRRDENWKYLDHARVALHMGGRVYGRFLESPAAYGGALQLGLGVRLVRGLYLAGVDESTERGTHESLMNLDGAYAGLYQQQLLEEELASA